MDYVEKTRRIEAHIKENPNDYQSVVSYLINRSKAIEQSRHRQMIERRKNVAKYRRQLDEKFR